MLFGNEVLYIILYMRKDKQIYWIGSTLEDLKSFPTNITREIGFDLNLLQKGLMPRDFKVMKGLGAGVMEIRVKEQTGAYRMIYIIHNEDALFCLHTFQKKSQKTSKKDLEIIKLRLKVAEKEMDYE